MWIRIDKDRKTKKHFVRDSKTKARIGDVFWTLNAAKEAAEYHANSSYHDTEVLGEDQAGEFVLGVYTGGERSDFVTDSEVLREAYARSLDLATNIKTQLLETFDASTIHGIATMMSALKALGQQANAVTRPIERGINYSALIRTLQGGDAKIGRLTMTPDKAAIAYMVSKWADGYSPSFSVQKDVRGIGKEKHSKVDFGSEPEPVAIKIDGKAHVFKIWPLSIGTLPSGDRFLVVVEKAAVNQCYGAQVDQLGIIGDPGILQEASNMVAEELVRHDIYKGRIVLIRNDHISAVVSKLSSTSWESVVPVPKLKEALDHLDAIVDNAKSIFDKGMSIKEGLLISGPPGIGKSVSLRAFLNAVVGKATVYYVECSSDLRHVYALAEKNAPSIVVLEDIDTIAQSRDKEYRHGHELHPDLLTVLSGVAQTGNVITIATTNYPEQLDDAIAKRPGRFDNHIKVPELSKDTKLAMLEHFLKQYDIDRSIWPKIKEMCAPLVAAASVGAHYERLVESAVKRATVQDRKPTVFDFQPQIEALMTVVSK